MININQEVVKRLIATRKSQKLTQEQVAKKMGVSRRYINKLENEYNKKLGFMAVLNYLNACEVNIPDFFADLEKLIAKQEYNQIISKIDFPKDYKLRQKVLRDIGLYHSSIKSIRSKAKPLSKQAQHEAVVKFGNYRTKIEYIESLAYKVIAQNGISTTLNPFYRAYIRQLYKTLKKNFISGINLDSGLDKIISKWVNQGLRQDLLTQIKDVIVKYFEPIKIGNKKS